MLDHPDLPVFLLALATCIGGFIAGFVTCALLKPTDEETASFDRGYDAGVADGLMRGRAERKWRDKP
jgi:hypothetical protein